MSVDSHLSSLDKSTNGRASLHRPNAGRRGVVAAVRALARIWPRAADPLLERLFLTAPRHRRPEWERERLWDGRRGAVDVGGVPLPTWSWGEGSTILLVHGWGGRGSQLGAFVAPLVDAGHRVVTFDGPGHGDAPRGLCSIVALAAAIEAVAKAEGPLEAVIAHSVGGAATALAASRAPIAKRFAFIGSPSHPGDFLAQFAAAFGLGEARLTALKRRLERRYAFDFAALDVRRDAPKMRAPLLLVHDAQDVEVPLHHAEGIAEAWPGASLHVTVGLGHRRVLRAPAVVERVVRFVAPAAAGPFSAEEALELELFERDRRWIPWPNAA